MKDKIFMFLKIFRRKLVEYILTNILFITYVIISVISIMLVRFFTLDELFSFRIMCANLGCIVLVGSLGYLIKAKNRFNYLFFLVIVFTIIGLLNTIYFKFYEKFASIGELSTAGQAGTVLDSVFDKLNPLDFIFILGPIIFYMIHKKLSKSSYYYYVQNGEKSKTLATFTGAVAALMLSFVFLTTSDEDFGRLYKQWNRVLVVEKFGVLIYHTSDIILNLTPKFTSLFGYDDALLAFNTYFEENPYVMPDNEYTGILEGKDLVFVHMESVQTFLMDLSFNGQEVTPNVNQLAEEGMFFSNFYPQISTGTSSDTEFTILTSLFPAQSGTVFVTYYDRDYTTLPKILDEQDYYSFSMHGNNFDMWNRDFAHPSLGYEGYYFKDKYEFEEEDEVGLGINDSLFFEQSFDYLVEIENEYPTYMGTIITLSNHSPYTDGSNLSLLDLSTTFEKVNVDGSTVTETTDYLLSGNKTIGKYLKSANYGDAALGEFMDMVRESDNFDDTLFVFYGDHDARMSYSDMNYLYNYDPETGELKEEDDESYVEYTSFEHDLSKKTPLILWTKNEELRNVITGEFDYPMGMIDLSPTILNMLGLSNPYALGNDIFTTKEDNLIIFPNSSFITKDMYYNNSTSEYKILSKDPVLSESYISDNLKIADEKLTVSNSIVVHDLIVNSKKDQK